MIVSDIMTKKVRTITANEPVSKAFGMMKRHGLNNIPVMSEGLLIGMITIKEVLSQPRYGTSVKVSNLMFMPPTISEDESIESVVSMITETGVNVIPVISGLRLVGIISDHDVLGVMKEEFEEVQVSDLMKNNVPLLEKNDATGKATRLMDYHKLTMLPVINDRGLLIGVIYDYDILKMFYKPREKAGVRMSENVAVGSGRSINPLSSPINVVTSSNYESLNPNDKVSKALKIMLKKDLNTLVIINDAGAPVGVLERRKLINYLNRKAGPRGVLLTFSGLKLDYAMNQLLTKVLRDHLLRVNYLAVGLNKVKVYIKPVHEGAGVRKYELNLTIYQRGGGVERTQKVGYDLRAVFDDALTDIERVMIKTYKKKRYNLWRKPRE